MAEPGYRPGPNFPKDPNWPKAKYHPTHGVALANNELEEKELGDGWYDSPAEFGVITAPSQAQLRKEELKRFKESEQGTEDEAQKPLDFNKPRKR